MDQIRNDSMEQKLNEKEMVSVRGDNYPNTGGEGLISEQKFIAKLKQVQSDYQKRQFHA